MIQGTLIAESLRVGADLAYPELTIRKISRYRAKGPAQGRPRSRARDSVTCSV
jgi:hypothetical protein